MPSLPTRYESQVAAQANRRIIEQPTFAPDTSTGDALLHVGQAGLEIATRIQKAQTDQELVKAEHEARTRLDKLKFDLEGDTETPDAAIPVRWRQESEAILKEVAAGISSTNARNLWTERAKGWQGDGEVWSLDLQRKRGVSKVRAGYITTLSGLEAQAGDMAITAETYAAGLQGASEAVKLGIEGGMVDPEFAAKYESDLKRLAQRDQSLRFVAGVDALAAAGKFDEAYKAVDDAKGILDPNERKDAQARVRQEQNRQEAERAKAQAANGNAYEVTILGGGGSLKEIDEGVKSGRFNINDQPTLIRAWREEQNRHEAEAAKVVKLSPAMQKAWDDQSADATASLDVLARRNPALFMGPIDSWPAAYQQLYYGIKGPDGQLIPYTGMTPDGQRAVAIKQLEMRDKGQTADAIDAVLKDLIAEAKRVAPTIMDGAKANDPKRIAFEGILYQNAKVLSLQQGGTPITADQARKNVLQALAEYDPGKSRGVNLALMAGDDPEGFSLVRRSLMQTLGRDPTADEIMAEYKKRAEQ